jgi:hypothetical protein
MHAEEESTVAYSNYVAPGRARYHNIDCFALLAMTEPELFEKLRRRLLRLAPRAVRQPGRNGSNVDFLRKHQLVSIPMPSRLSSCQMLQTGHSGPDPDKWPALRQLDSPAVTPEQCDGLSP